MSIFRQTLQHVEEQVASAVAAERSGAAAVERRRDERHARDRLRALRDDAPAPTGARIRGWFTGLAAALVVVACAVGWFTPSPGLERRRSLSLPPSSGRCFRPQRAVAVDHARLARHQRADGDRRDRRDRDPPVRRGRDGGVAVRGGAVARGAKPRSRAQGDRPAARSRAQPTCWSAISAGERRIDIEHVDPGALMIVRPGEKIALDGIVRNGRSDVNQAPITGESLPVEKVEGDEVFAGTINGHGALTVAVTRRRADTTLARIVHLVESAQAQARADAAVHRSLCRVVHAVGRDPGGAGRDAAGAGVRPAVRHLAVSRAGAARGVVSVRAGDLDAGVDRVGARRRGAAGRAGQGRHSSRAPGRRARRGLRQDRHRHDRPADARCGACRSTATAPTICWRWRRRSNRNRSIRLPRRSSRRARARGMQLERAAEVRALPGLGVEGRVAGRRHRLRHAAAVCRARRDDAGDCRTRADDRHGRHVARGRGAQRTSDRRARRQRIARRPAPRRWCPIFARRACRASR